MLQQLHIQNYAIIHEINIRFSGNLNIITGETGAGKSILMGALSLILGDRAESSALMQKDKKCVVEGIFAVAGNQAVEQFLTAHELDVEPELVIRREISQQGKSRAFINDTPVNLTQLKSLSGLLVDLHQQFDTAELGDSQFQQQVLDALAENGQLLLAFQTTYHEYTLERKKLETLQQQQQAANAALDYNQFLYDELAEAGFVENEVEELEKELKLLSNAEQVQQQLGAVYTELSESEQPLVQQLKVLSNKLHGMQQYHSSIEELANRLQAAQVEVQDISDELDRIAQGIQYSPERIQVVNDKISLGYKLFRKHNVPTTNDLLEIQQQLSNKLGDILNISEQLSATQLKVDELLNAAQLQAQQLSKNRHQVAEPLAKQVNTLLVRVGMPNARIKVQLRPASLHQNGLDDIEFLFDANKSDRFEPLRKVASGGELSRLMLCIKSLVAQKLALPTLIFDEIDTGISGEAAKQVGGIMKDLAATHQLIAITHQPQIAARADAHYFVYKGIQGDAITTAIRALSMEERITAIAQMLSGEKPTAAALQNAREMVSN